MKKNCYTVANDVRTTQTHAKRTITKWLWPATRTQFLFTHHKRALVVACHHDIYAAELPRTVSHAGFGENVSPENAIEKTMELKRLGDKWISNSCDFRSRSHCRHHR
ncbi:uncharacterized protein LOC112690191 [Sipha flava]|uniref:Uncharacterized protein LOC112690191 n=1 Tax=Sipha flava TaxID=143950 RepID=A0A8B8GAY0_9HEMI|nr:uncharacterized protein LOC112690191 [Sipha flava]